MRDAINCTERVARERQQPSCGTCGVGNRPTAGAVKRGFPRCGHCGSAIPVAGAGCFAFDGSGFTRGVRARREGTV